MNSPHIVVFRLGSIGDTIVALPCFHAIRQAYPSARITLLTNFPISAKAAPMYELLGTNSGIVDDSIDFSVGLKNPFEAFRLLLKLRKLNSSTLVYMRSGPTLWMIIRDTIFFTLAGFRNILCVPQSKDQRVSRINSLTLEVEPEAQRLARCFSPFGPISLTDSRNWELFLSDAELSQAKEIANLIPSPFLLIHTGGKALEKDWGLRRWSKFLKEFREQSNVSGLAIVGSHDDYQRAEEFVNLWGDQAVNLCGRLSPRVVSALISHSHLFIGHDSGPLHLAQCSGSYALGIFGSYNKPKQWHPLSSTIKIIHDQRGVEHISVSDVLSVSLSIWNRV